MPVLENHRRELFAQGVAKGLLHVRAYAEAGYAGNAVEGAKRLMQEDEVRARITELKEHAAADTVFGMQEAMRFLIEVIETPVGTVDQNSRICQEWTRDELSTRTATSRARKTAVPTASSSSDDMAEQPASGRKRARKKTADDTSTPKLDLDLDLGTASPESEADHEPEEVTPVLSRIKVKMPDKLKALELLAKFSPHGWFGPEKRKVELSNLDAVIAAVSREGSAFGTKIEDRSSEMGDRSSKMEDRRLKMGPDILNDSHEDTKARSNN